MAVRKDTIFERFLAPIFRLAIDGEKLKETYQGIDWNQEGDRYRQPRLVYPEYYTSQNFHGIEGGYLNSGAAVSYDPITQYVLPPGESIVRQAAIDAVQGQPRRILDLGCGTGSTTLLLKQAFPQAEVIGMDLSPYMLVVADMKAKKAGLEIQWRHGNAEEAGFPDAAFDLVTASLLFHETPPAVSRAILRESFRLLTVGGQILILDGNQRTLRQVEWLKEVFEEPYIESYATGSLDAWMGEVGFGAVRTEDVWWLNQITLGVKPLPGRDPESVSVRQRSTTDTTPDFEGIPSWPAPA